MRRASLYLATFALLHGGSKVPQQTGRRIFFCVAARVGAKVEDDGLDPIYALIVNGRRIEADAGPHAGLGPGQTVTGTLGETEIGPGAHRRQGYYFHQRNKATFCDSTEDERRDLARTMVARLHPGVGLSEVRSGLFEAGFEELESDLGRFDGQERTVVVRL